MKKFSSAVADPFGRVDLAGIEPLDQVFDGDVDVDELVGLGEDAIGDAFLDLDVGDALDLVVKALEVLDVQGADDVDSRVQQVFDILVAFRVARAGALVWASSSTRQMVGRRAKIASTSISRSVTPRYSTTRGGDDLEVADLLLGLGATVGFDQADDDVDPLCFQAVTLAEHRVGLADARGRAQIDLEPAPRLTADQVQELLGTGSLELGAGHGRLSLPRRRDQRRRLLALSSARFKSSTLTRGGAPRIAPDRLVRRSIRRADRVDRQSPALATRGA